MLLKWICQGKHILIMVIISITVYFMFCVFTMTKLQTKTLLKLNLNKSHKIEIKSNILNRNLTFRFHVHENTNFLHPLPYFSVQQNIVNHQNYSYVVEPPRNFCDKKTFLVIIVPSIHEHSAIRDTIRQTWGSQQWPNKKLTDTKLLFLFGLPHEIALDSLIKQEAVKYNDILYANYVDSYFNLTVKVLNGFRWISEHCAEVQYILKADEDTFTNVPLIIDFLKLNAVSQAVVGHLHEDSSVKRVGKWAVSKSVFPSDTYPDYMAGNTYVISGDILCKLVNISQYVPYLYIEDVYITGILVRALQCRHVDVIGFTQWASHKPSICDIINNTIITGNQITSQYAQTIWKVLHDPSSENC